jgi:hypothetical protein
MTVPVVAAIGRSSLSIVGSRSQIKVVVGTGGLISERFGSGT